MPKTDGEKTKRKILLAAERLFAKKGFRGTSMSEIAEAVGVNKALLYYYFKDKDDIVLSLFRNIVEELDKQIGQLGDPGDDLEPAARSRKMVEQELTYLAGKQRIIAVMLMEALKGTNTDDFLFQCAEAVIQHDVGGPSLFDVREGAEDVERQQFLADEFFMGFIPLVGFVVFRDKWCKYFKCDPDKALDYFLEAFARSHLAFHSLEDDSGTNEA